MSDAKDTVLLVDAVSPIKDEGIIVSQPEDEGFTASHVSEMTRSSDGVLASLLSCCR